ncbi:metH [Symbiodinium sp. CCMP2592]|nr:metH [Symbiodinium sp. CCMP2592]
MTFYMYCYDCAAQLRPQREGCGSYLRGQGSHLPAQLQDVIFDCSVLTIATGLPERNSYAVDLINAVAEMKCTCPCRASFSGGLSNPSFSFRGLNSLRDAMHSVFLYRAVPKGLNMSIVNPGGRPRNEDIEPKTQEEVILHKSADGNHVELFLEYAEQVMKPPAPAPAGRRSRVKPGCKVVDRCRVEGPKETQKVAQKIIDCKTATPTEVINYFNSELKKCICFLDGGMGTRIQAENLEEADYRGDRFKDFSEKDANGIPVSLKGNDALPIFSKPDMIKDIHKEYFVAGSDICQTNTFNGTTILQGEYKMQAVAHEINKVGAQLAKKAAAEVTKQEPHKPRLVAGAVGPTGRTLSVSPSVEDPSFRTVTWGELVESYKQQVSALVEGGVDLLMIETVFDTQNCKAAIFAVDQYFIESKKERLPVMLSATIVDKSGRTLSGQTIEAFCVSVKHAQPFTVGINCALGAAQMKGFYKKLYGMNSAWCHVHPNAGLPNAMGGYDEDPEIFCSNILDYAKDGILNFVGGCCLTFPFHIAAVCKKVKDCPVRKLPELPGYPSMMLSGLEPCHVTAEAGFHWAGERCNLMGSAKFKKLVDAYRWDEAMEVCVAQCETKVDNLDFNFDSDLIDGQSAMRKFMRLCVTEPTVAKLPFMFDSSKWPAVEEGLKCVQGKCVVNSISLKVGEEEFLRLAKLCMRYGAAVVIMAFDEKGQAGTFEDKVRICQRLCESIDFPREDINVLTIATGLPERNSYAVDFINAVAEMKCTCPCRASFSGGLSNPSFFFRGLNSLRDSMHGVFVYHAVPKGLDMSIVNPGGLPRYTDIDESTRKLAEEVILNQSADGKHAGVPSDELPAPCLGTAQDAEKRVLARFEEMGFSDKELQADSSFLAASRGRRKNGLLQAVLSWIQDLAPVMWAAFRSLTHVAQRRYGVDAFAWFCRSQFETKTSYGAIDEDHLAQQSDQDGSCTIPCGRAGNQTRIAWERDIFEDAYDDAKPFERCKYGALNGGALSCRKMPVTQSAATFLRTDGSDVAVACHHDLGHSTTLWGSYCFPAWRDWPCGGSMHH